MTEASRVAFVTGGRRGIGRGIALALADEGFDIVINDLIEDDALYETVTAVTSKRQRCKVVLGSVADVENVQHLADQAWACFGHIDTLVNNAGVTVQSRGDLLDVTPQSYDLNVDTNLRGPFFLTQSIARKMIAYGESATYRSIICISSTNAETISPTRGEYCIAKTGVSMMVRLFAARMAEYGIGVHEIRPGLIKTDMSAAAGDKYTKMIDEGLTPLRRWGLPTDIGSALAAIAIGKFAFSTGSAFELDGGMHMRLF